MLQLRRLGGVVGGAFSLGPWLVQPGLNSISRNGTTHRLEPKLMEVLVCLAGCPGEAVSKETLLKTVWPDTFVSDDVLTRSISELRRVFQDDPREPRFIETIPKRGYRLVAPMEAIDPQSTRATVQATSRASNHRISPAQVVVASASSLVLVALIVVSVGGLKDRGRLADAAPAIHSLAVLPLQNLSTDPAQEFFAEGITDALITDLAQINALRVVSRTTIMQYGRPQKPLPQIARELHVDGIVEGTVQRAGDRVRITAQLIYGPADRHLWADTFDRNVSDVLAIQSAIAREIAEQVKVKVTPAEQAKLQTPRSLNPKALDAYFEARFHLGEADKLEFHRGASRALIAHLQKAESSLDLALQLDPNYMPAYAAFMNLVDVSNVSRLQFLPRAREVLIAGTQRDERNFGVHLALARLLMQYDYDWAGAGQEYKKAVELAPSSAEAHNQYAEYLDNIEGALDNAADVPDAQKERDLAQALDPANDYNSVCCDGLIHFARGMALDQQRQRMESEAPDDPFLIGVLAKQFAMAGRFQESVDLWERCLTIYGWLDYVKVMKRANQKGGPRYALEQWMRAGEESAKTDDSLPTFVAAFTYASLGNKDRAFAWLDKALEQRNWCIIYLKRDNVWDPLRSDPRFSALLQRVGLRQ